MPFSRGALYLIRSDRHPDARRRHPRPRVIHNAYRIDLAGESLRKRGSSP